MALNQLRKVVVAIIGIGVMAAMALGEGDSSGISARIMGKGALNSGKSLMVNTQKLPMEVVFFLIMLLNKQWFRLVAN